MKLVCEKCKGDNIVQRAWVDPNTGDIKSACSDGEPEDNWCDDCNQHIYLNLIDEDELDEV